MIQNCSTAGSFSRSLFVTVIAVLAGCADGDRLPTAPARGTVWLDGRPLANAHVVFTPERGRSATGQTGADGTFVLTSYDSGDGVIVGHHRATVTAQEIGEFDTPGAPGIHRPGKSLIPVRYNSTATSGLEFDVHADQRNVFELRLSSQAGN